MEKVCPRCGGSFICMNDSIMDCHCISVALDEAQRRFIAANYDDCLCNACLRIIEETFYSAGINPRYVSDVEPNFYLCSEK